MRPALSRAKARAALMQELEHAMRRSSAQGVIFGQTVANVAGISSSDLECLDFLNLEGRVTAGRLAEVTGLTTGAITGVVDRLEKAGLVRRERDESDRRKVFIAVVPENDREDRPVLRADAAGDAEGLGAPIRTRSCDCCCVSPTRATRRMLAATEELKATDRCAAGEAAPISKLTKPSALTGAAERACRRCAAANMPHIAPSIIQKCRQWSVSMMKLSPTVPRKAAKTAR